MIYSMTGYAVAAAELAFGALNVELRSVNHRYLDIQFRIPDELRPLEAGLRERASARINRGKVEVRIAIAKSAASQSNLQLDDALLGQLALLNARVKSVLAEGQSLSVADVLRWPGMLGNDNLVPDELQEACGQLLDRALDDLTASRAREGEKLKGLLLERIASMEALVGRPSKDSPDGTFLKNADKSNGLPVSGVMGLNCGLCAVAWQLRQDEAGLSTGPFSLPL